MPNWCENSLTLTHEDSSMIDRAEKAIKDGSLFSEFHPCPKELIETKSGFFGNEGYAAELQKFTEELNKKYFGYRDWYDWNLANWGTKWDICDAMPSRQNEHTIYINFNTAWSPPIGFYEKMAELGFTIDAIYYEPGMCFCGSWEDGIDECFKIDGNSDWVRKHIPQGIDNEFAISETMALYEEEEQS